MTPGSRTGSGRLGRVAALLSGGLGRGVPDPGGQSAGRLRRVLLAVLGAEVLLLFLAGSLPFFGDGRCGGPRGTGSRRGGPVVARILVRDLTPRGEHPVEGGLLPSDLEAAVRRALGRDGRVRVPVQNLEVKPTDEEANYRVKVEVALFLGRGGLRAPDNQRGMARAAVTLDMERISGGGGLESYQGRSVGEVPYDADHNGPAGPFFLRLVERTVADSFGSVLVQFEARGKTVETLIHDLQAPDPEVRLAALRTLGRRRSQKAVAPIAALLRDEREDIVLAAVGALAAIGAPEAVTPLVDSTRGRSTEYLATVLYAVADIGGGDAAAFLDTLAVGHPDPEIRRKATEALESLRSRAAR